MYVGAAAVLITILGRLFWAKMPIEDFPARYTVLPGAMLLVAVMIVAQPIRRLADDVDPTQGSSGVLDPPFLSPDQRGF